MRNFFLFLGCPEDLRESNTHVMELVICVCSSVANRCSVAIDGQKIGWGEVGSQWHVVGRKPRRIGMNPS